ncbi:tRNA (adenosine(37)-N6)-threonylcarbamoyltransferase complex ATPase subunit type 1 TsaE [Candidatus Dependentiae bacterium]|nr:tRNA (adenosine(37)-N6)-threonylcarbamoyltransferase complex ATPase subunit type 1 TsaE [Candidatus Dependentiae bacterium]MBU4387323.1 tRNA (adenosine(37)-N6)-threonylcarbamoyltransferase complex ATPase subunit type 1 TsaE [Candidatus Dependentiae bacterium]MCG2756212.1 tRNA (adenosine(37)-N6)-threonylcarbamoyltransferase complex ATPase subunit type 1 TsaE [Candidatus Dependentiae bacterium]
MKIFFELKDLDKIIKEYILPFMNKKKIFLFKGALGVGKTTLIKQIMKNCGIKELITSPTFNYVNNYKSEKNVDFYHFDLYRLDSQDSFLNLGFDEYLYKKNSYSFIEWPDVIHNITNNIELRDEICFLELSFIDNNFEKRMLVIS